jgi:acyl-CoA thioester hydrolase
VRKQGVISAEIEFDVPFHDVDMVGVVWHGHYLRYFENARWVLMDTLGYGLGRMLESGCAWPVVEMQAKYLSPARFQERLTVRSSLVEWQSRLVLNYLITRSSDGARVARARSVQVAVDGRTGELLFQCPACFVECVNRALAQ